LISLSNFCITTASETLIRLDKITIASRSHQRST